VVWCGWLGHIDGLTACAFFVPHLFAFARTTAVEGGAGRGVLARGDGGGCCWCGASARVLQDLAICAAWLHPAGPGFEPPCHPCWLAPAWLVASFLVPLCSTDGLDRWRDSSTKTKTHKTRTGYG